MIMATIPFYVYALMALAALLSVFFFYKAAKKTVVLVIVLVWAVIQSAISLTGFYKTEDTMPPRVALLLMPAIVCIIVLFATKAGRKFIDSLDIKWLTLMHAVRIPVELALHGLFLCKLIPQLMTFEGRNFDIIAGISSVAVYYFAFVKKSMGKKWLLAWNFFSLALLMNILVNAILSMPTVLQQFAFDQPNIGLFRFPFTILPAVIVPLVLFSHLAVIRRLAKK
jgi:hypothetical protein